MCAEDGAQDLGYTGQQALLLLNWILKLLKEKKKKRTSLSLGSLGNEP